MSLNVGKNDYGREINYIVFHSESSQFTFTAKRFNKKRVIKECKDRGVESPVIVRWETMTMHGFDMKESKVSWKE